MHHSSSNEVGCHTCTVLSRLLQAIFVPNISLAAHSCWSDQLGYQLVRAGHHYASWFWVGVIDRELALPCESGCPGGFSAGKGKARHTSSTSIVYSISKLNNTSGAAGRSMEGGGISYSQVCAAGDPCDGCWINRHINACDFELGSRIRSCGCGCRGCRRRR